MGTVNGAPPGRPINVGMLGLGTIGSSVAKTLGEKSATVAAQIGRPLHLKRVLVRDISRPRQVPADLLTTDPDDILADPDIDIVIEVIGGEQPALDYIRAALEAGKHVVTANKEVMAKHGPDLLALAQQHEVDVAFEASVGGGIPLIGPFRRDLLANDISTVYAIINGTTNFILTRMAEAGLDFAPALAEAQQLGYAEPDPRNDVDGIDAAYKLAVLATLGFKGRVRPEDVFHEGISRLEHRDFRYAAELGYAIKLLAIAKKVEGRVEVRVHPTCISQDHPLARVNGVFNAVYVEADLVGPVLFYGRGAGPSPTSSAIVGDVIAAARAVRSGSLAVPAVRFDVPVALRPMDAVRTRYYFRMEVADRPGVLSQISRVFGDNGISISSVIQKEGDGTSRLAELVIMTHLAREQAVQVALRRLAELDVVRQVCNFLRVEG